MSETKIYAFKIVLCGESGVGKTSIRRNFMGKGFLTPHLTTLGADFALKKIIVNEQKVELQIWDVAGQKTFELLRKRFFIGTNGAFLVFDLTNKETLYKLTEWLQEVYGANKGYKIPIVLLGNKRDLEDRIAVSDDEIQAFIDELKERPETYGLEIPYMPTSALTGENIERAFEEIVKQIMKTKKII